MTYDRLSAPPAAKATEGRGEAAAVVEEALASREKSGRGDAVRKIEGFGRGIAGTGEARLTKPADPGRDGRQQDERELDTPQVWPFSTGKSRSRKTSSGAARLQVFSL
jgi:hypothetical protein